VHPQQILHVVNGHWDFCCLLLPAELARHLSFRAAGFPLPLPLGISRRWNK
jgi:hypothetical protein